jgi:hypothetical protein
MKSSHTFSSAETEGDDQCLTEGMCVPGGARAGIKRDLASSRPRRIGRFVHIHQQPRAASCVRTKRLPVGKTDRSQRARLSLPITVIWRCRLRD